MTTKYYRNLSWDPIKIRLSSDSLRQEDSNLDSPAPT